MSSFQTFTFPENVTTTTLLRVRAVINWNAVRFFDQQASTTPLPDRLQHATACNMLQKCCCRKPMKMFGIFTTFLQFLRNLLFRKSYNPSNDSGGHKMVTKCRVSGSIKTLGRDNIMTRLHDTSDLVEDHIHKLREIFLLPQ